MPSLLIIIVTALLIILCVVFFIMLAKTKKERKEFQATAFWYKSILDAIPLPITITDAAANWTFINKRVENFLGVKLEDIIGKPCSNWGANICNTPNCGIECAKRGVKETYFSHNGASYKVDVEILKDLSGNTAGYIEIVQDVTQLEEVSKKQLNTEAISKAKSSFIATVSHEIRTPMNAIIGIADIEMQDQTISQRTREAFIKIHNSGELLLYIINDILDFSKIDAGKLEIIPDNYYVPSLVNDTVYLNILRINSKPIEFDLRINENIPTILLGDEIRIKQILNNLLSNAFKYTEKGRVTLSINIENNNDTENGDVTLVFVIKDTGIGMTNDDINNLFNEYTRFQQDTTNRTTEGTGLGMSITKHLIRLMNGEIYVESKPNEGSTFTVKLPQKKVNSFVIGKELVDNLQNFQYDSSPIAKKTQITRESMPYGKVLIVDDVETNLYVAKGLMVPYDLNIDLAISGFEAIDKIFSGNTYDIIFMDHMMPKMDGIEAVKIIRENGYKNTIIALTANTVIGQAETFIANGFDDFISKPIDIRQLNTMLNKFIRDKQSAEVREEAQRNKSMSIINNAQSHEISEEVLKFFLKDAKKSILIIEESLRNDFSSKEDIKNYIINIHAMKSALANIGEHELSAIAANLEQMARENKIYEITSKTSAFIDLLQTLVNKLNKMDNNETIINTEEELIFLRKKLIDIQEACSSYDKKSAKEALNALKEKQWAPNETIILDNISEYLLHSDFQKTAALIKDFTFSVE